MKFEIVAEANWLDEDAPVAEEEIEVLGIGNLSEDQLGKTFGKWSWCGDCEALTFNVPGETYGGRPIGKKEKRGWVFRDGKQIELADSSLSELKEIFFACQKCGKEKFWLWGYRCPQCDSDLYAVLEIGKAEYSKGAAMEFGGTPLDWDETWKCCVCGYVYVIRNGNY